MPKTLCILSSFNSLVGALTGFKRLPDFRDLALNPYHELLESPGPALFYFFPGFPDGHQFSTGNYDKCRNGPDRDFLVARDNPSNSNSLIGALTGFKRLPDFRDLALNPYHELLESPDPGLFYFFPEFPDGD